MHKTIDNTYIYSQVKQYEHQIITSKQNSMNQAPNSLNVEKLQLFQ